MKKKIFLFFVLFVLGISSTVQAQFASNPVIYQDGTHVQGGGRVLDFKTGLQATFNAATGRYEVSATGEATVGEDSITPTQLDDGADTPSVGEGVFISASDATKFEYKPITADVTSSGDCLGGACHDGTSDGGTYIRLHETATGFYGQISASGLSGNTTYTLPNQAGTLLSSGYLANSAALAGLLSNETGTGVAVFATAPTFSGAIGFNGAAVNDDDCTGQIGKMWFDSTDSAFEFCQADSGVPDSLGSVAASNTYTIIPFIINGNGGVISAGASGTKAVPFAGTITGWYAYSNVSGSVVVDIKKSDYAGYDTFASIAGTEKPTISAGVKASDTSLTTWTATVAQGDLLRAVVDSADINGLVTVFLIIQGD